MNIPSNASSLKFPNYNNLYNQLFHNSLNSSNIPQSFRPQFYNQTIQNIYSPLVLNNSFSPHPFNQFLNSQLPFMHLLPNQLNKQKNTFLNQKNQIKKKQNSNNEIIIISDDQDQNQHKNNKEYILNKKQQKINQVKTTNPITNNINKNMPIYNLQKNQKFQNRITNSITQFKKITVKQIPKIIEQPPKLNKPIKKFKEDFGRSHLSSQYQIRKLNSLRSQRIKKMSVIKYKLGRRQRQLFQISFLRDYVNDVLTGPTFQATLPPFNNRLQQNQMWKKSIKQNLLSRKVQQFSDLEQ